jgi:hypothetical protein
MTTYIESFDARASQTDDELYASLWEYASLEGGLDASPPNLKQQIERAKIWLAAKTNETARSICSKPLVCMYCDDDEITNAVIGAILEELTGRYGTRGGVTIAVILVRQGLKGICASL